LDHGRQTSSKNKNLATNNYQLLSTNIYKRNRRLESFLVVLIWHNVKFILSLESQLMNQRIIFKIKEKNIIEVTTKMTHVSINFGY
jgi:hypothetical protein